MALTQGFFKPTNPTKYKGDPTSVIYRSGWELRLMSRFDLDDSIIEWSSEEKIVQYRCKSDGRIHRYFPDFLIKVKDINGKIKTIMIEVKPLKQTLPPERPKDNSAKAKKRFLQECLTFAKNTSKFEAAEIYCKDRGWVFQIMTEKDLFS